MSNMGRVVGPARPRPVNPILACALSAVLLIPAWAQDPAPDPDTQAPTGAAAAPPYAQQGPEQLQQLVAPIALYPDSLVAQAPTGREAIEQFL